jgi:hypothetical protein
MHSAPGVAPRVGLVTLLALAASLGGCSALLDWTGFSGGEAPIVDAGTEGGDAGDGGTVTPPVCGPDICGGCCNDAGLCVGGASVTTCGAGGKACVSCAPAGQVCSNGECAAPVVDAAPPAPCSPNTCPLMCAPVYETNCCKGDGTCGCAVQIPTMGSCM